ncbi:MAG: MBL fold metallo-hydrolase [Candidatus Thiodiazotropha sp. (ex Ctena orbiculata)]|nr:MBL fold metallo-hydrolase [Candidatus Thiodiazotropha taylori]
MALQMYVHDVGHGQSVHLISPAGEVIVIDLGCSSTFSPLEWLSSFTKTIDCLIITHPHGDHIDEFLDIKKHKLNVRQLWRPKDLPKEEVYKQNQTEYTDKLDAYYSMSDRYNKKIEDNARVGNPSVSGGMLMTSYRSNDCGISSINNHSLVSVIEYLGFTIVVPGDNEVPSWNALLKNTNFANVMQRANIFMASHHGRVNGYCEEIFISKPDLCIVSDGRVQSTDARDRYTYHANGMKVHKRQSKSVEERSCVTTRADGYVFVNIDTDASNSPTLTVEID